MTNIYIGNLPYGATEEEIREMFAPFGNVTKVSIISDRMTGRSRGFGFVEMAEESDAQAAIEGLNGKDMGGRPLTVNVARPKAPRGGGGRHGGGGRGRY